MGIKEIQFKDFKIHFTEYATLTKETLAIFT